jgi:hypothetical protein
MRDYCHADTAREHGAAFAASRFVIGRCSEMDRSGHRRFHVLEEQTSKLAGTRSWIQLDVRSTI